MSDPVIPAGRTLVEPPCSGCQLIPNLAPTNCLLVHQIKTYAPVVLSGCYITGNFWDNPAPKSLNLFPVGCGIVNILWLTCIPTDIHSNSPPHGATVYTGLIMAGTN